MIEHRSADAAGRGIYAPQLLAVVGRGNAARFRFLCEHLEGAGLARVIWDRRQADRRNARVPGAIDRRTSERRQPSPASWTALSFLLASSEGGPESRPDHARRGDRPHGP